MCCRHQHPGSGAFACKYVQEGQALTGMQDPIYQPKLTLLAKLLFLSSAIHQLIFATCSTLPFAVGQVQDVGLIFLSAMATSVAQICGQANQGPDIALGTTLLTLTASTAMVGIVTFAVGTFEKLSHAAPSHACISAFCSAAESHRRQHSYNSSRQSTQKNMQMI